MSFQRSTCLFFYFIAMGRCSDLKIYYMTDDNDLKLTLQSVVSYAVTRMESESDTNIRRCIFQEYREWLGKSIDDWVLALPNDLRKSDSNYH